MSIFSLQPFAASPTLPQVQIDGQINRTGDRLRIDYHLRGDLAALAIAPPAQIPTRQDDLWQHTCFEFFLGCKGSPRYWEVNLSPAGDWNVYRFSDYRQGMESEQAFAELPFSCDRQPNAFRLSLTLDLSLIVAKDQPLEVAITTVVQQLNGHLSYWALTHPGPEADFHRRDGFQLELAESEIYR
jgi:hypothetical protein